MAYLSAQSSITALFAMTALFSGTLATFANPSPPAPSVAVSDLQNQFATGEYETAIALADEKIKALNRRFERYGPELYLPLKIKADALSQLGYHDAAIGASLHALQVLRMNEGLYSAAQVDLLRRLAESHHSLGNAVEANGYEEAAFAMAQRVHDERSVGMQAARHRLATWYLKAGYHSSSRKLFETSRAIARADLPSKRAAYVQSLNGIADTYLLEAFPNFDHRSNAYYSQFVPADMQVEKQLFGKIAGPEVSHATAFRHLRGGERVLRELVAFQRAELDRAEASGNATADARKGVIGSLINLGDWHIRLREPRQALAAFIEARGLMTREAAEQEFSVPKLLYMPKIEAPVMCFADTCTEYNLSQRKDLEAGEVQLSVRVTNHGMVSRVTKVATTPQDFVVFRYKQETRRARYRPAMVDGEFIDYEGLPVVHPFKYVPASSADREPLPPSASRNASSAAELAASDLLDARR